jgi:hypothetical protein
VHGSANGVHGFTNGVHGFTNGVHGFTDRVHELTTGEHERTECSSVLVMHDQLGKATGETPGSCTVTRAADFECNHEHIGWRFVNWVIRDGLR